MVYRTTEIVLLVLCISIPRYWTTLGQNVNHRGLDQLTVANQSCVEFGIVKGDELETSCESHCAKDKFEVFDWAAPRESDRKIFDRNTWCRCLDPTSGNKTFECSDLEEEVWTLGTSLKTCDTLNLTSGTKCENYCKENIDIGYRYDGSGDTLQCYCGSNPEIHICGRSSANFVAPGWFSLVTWSMVLTLSASFSLSLGW